MIRFLEKQDAKALNQINTEQLGYAVSIEVTQAQLKKLLNDSKHHFLLGFEDSQTHEILGYIHAEVYETLYSDTLFNVLALAVSKENQHTGIGKKLIQALEKEAHQRHYSAIRLNSGMNRTQAHQFYEAVGYDGTKSQKRFIKLF